MQNDQTLEYFRDSELSEYLGEDCEEPIDLIRCDGCGEEVEESEIKLFKMHDVNDGKELQYCKECISIYREENL